MREFVNNVFRTRYQVQPYFGESKQMRQSSNICHDSKMLSFCNKAVSILRYHKNLVICTPQRLIVRREGKGMLTSLFLWRQSQQVHFIRFVL